MRRRQSPSPMFGLIVTDGGDCTARLQSDNYLSPNDSAIVFNPKRSATVVSNQLQDETVPIPPILAHYCRSAYFEAHSENLLETKFQ